MKTPEFITKADYENAVLRNIERSVAIEELNKLILAKMKPVTMQRGDTFITIKDGEDFDVMGYVFKMPEPCDHIINSISVEGPYTSEVLSGICPKCQEAVQ